MEVQLLGPCRIIWNGKPWLLRRRQVRALLYRLAVQPTPVARASLAFLFWPDEADAVALRRLTRLISSLRAALPEPRCLLVTEETLALDPNLVRSDAWQFLRDAGADDMTVQAEAAALYRGPLMTGFELPEAPEFATWQAECARAFETRHLALLEHLANRHAASGDLAAAIRYAQQYLNIDELAEPMHRCLIGLYVGTGDRAAALRQLDRCTLVLERELGVSPLPETRAAISTLRAPQSRPTVPVLPSLELPLVGREHVLARLERAYDRFAGEGGRRGGLIVISGEPGSGKSRLLREFLARRQQPLLVSAFHADEGILPYAGLIRALRGTLPERELWEAVPAHWRSELLPLLPELRTIFSDLAPPVATRSPVSTQHLCTALTETLCTFAGRGITLLCLDDLHLADAATFGWLRSLATTWGDRPLVVVAVVTQATQEVERLCSLLRRADRIVGLTLGNLTLEAVRQLLRHLPQAPAPNLIERIYTATDGNPFFVLETVRDLQERRQLATPPADLPLPATVREAILSRVNRVSPVARQLLEAAVILAPNLDDTLLRHTAARTSVETVDALEELVAHDLLRASAHEASATRLTLPHALLRRTVLDTLSPWRRKLLHHRAAEVLARIRREQPAVLAHHLVAAEQWDAAIVVFEQAAEHASAMYASAVALIHVEAAFALLAQAAEPETTRLRLLRRRLALRRTLVQISEWRADTEELLRAAAFARDDEARLAALEAQISLCVLQSDFALIEPTAAEALVLAERMGDRLAAGRIHHTLGWHLADALGRSREGLRHLETARDLAQEAGDVRVLYQTLCNLAFAQRAEGCCTAARTSAERALALAGYRPDSAPHPAFADALRELGEANAYLGHWEEARRRLQPLLNLYHTLDDAWAYGTVLYNYGLYSSNMGQHHDAIAALRRLVSLSEEVGLPPDSDYGIWHRAGLARVLIAAGEHAEAGTLLHSLNTSSLAPGRPYLAWAKAIAEYHLATGEVPAALSLLMLAVDWWRPHTSPHDADLLLLMAQVAVSAGQRPLAELAAAEAATSVLATDMRRYHLRLYAVRFQISGDPADLAAARAELTRQAALFGDAELRAAFLERVGLHRQITAPQAL
jgi:DNA-binding SARP family transcriptional activator/tetratricopeptide (TPR) repeat protein